MAELKKCPFCGGEAMLVPLSSCSGEIACGDCHFESATYWNDMRAGGTEKWQDKAVKAWNSRADEAEIRNKAIDDYMNLLCEHCMQEKNECYILECPFCTDGCDIINFAEQLKEE